MAIYKKKNKIKIERHCSAFAFCAPIFHVHTTDMFDVHLCIRVLTLRSNNPISLITDLSLKIHINERRGIVPVFSITQSWI